MGVAPAKFDSAGKSSQHYIPGVYSRDHIIGGSTGVSSGNLCIIGTSQDGKPNTLLVFADKNEAEEILAGGTLLEGVAHAFNGSNDFIPQQVFGVRVGNAKQAKSTMSNGTDEILEMDSSGYGARCNQIKRWLRDGATGRKFLASFKGEDVEIDNITRASFSIMYTGGGESATCTIGASGLSLKAFDSSNDEIAEESLEVGWEECPTIEGLAARITDSGFYSATLLDMTPDAKSSELDHITGVSVSDASATVIKSDLQALIDAINGIKWISNVRLKDGAPRVMPENDDGFVYFTGGTNGTTSVADYVKALELLENEDIQIVSTPSTDKQIHSLISDHCASMRTVEKRRERTFIVGTAKNVSMEEGLAEARSLNTELGSLIITGANANSPLDGSAQDIAPSILACKVAGIEAALGVSNPITNKQIKVNAFDHKYKTGELNKMIAGGIMPFGENEEGLLVCIRAMTTYQGDSLIQNERSMIRSVLYMARDVRKAYQQRIGTNSEPSVSDILQILHNKAKEWYLNDLLTKDDNGRLVWNEKVRFDGDKTYLFFDRYIRAPVNFIFITPTNRVYSSPIEL